MVLASRGSGCLFGHPNPYPAVKPISTAAHTTIVVVNRIRVKKQPSGHPKFLVKNFLKCKSQEYNQIFSSPYYSYDIVLGYQALF